MVVSDTKKRPTGVVLKNARLTYVTHKSSPKKLLSMKLYMLNLERKRMNISLGHSMMMLLESEGLFV